MLLKSCTRITSSERSEKLKILHNRHHRSCDGCILFKYAVRVKKYTEQYRIENKGLRKADLDCLWTNDGFGINVEVCGYAWSSLALLRMKQPHVFPSPISLVCSKRVLYVISGLIHLISDPCSLLWVRGEDTQDPSKARI